MSKTSGNRIVLAGKATQRVPGFSLYLLDGNKDLLFELVGVHRTSSDPLDYPDEKYEIFVSTSTLDKEGNEKKSERNRKLLCSNVSPKEAVEKIRHEVMHKYREYKAQSPSAWWTPIPEADLEQIRVHNFMRMDSSRIQMDHLLEMYAEDTYVAGLFYDGPRVKAHFCGGDQNRVRFDTMSKDSQGIYQEVTDVLAHAVGDRGPEAAHFLDGTILDGYVIHGGGSTKVGALFGLDALQAEAWIIENGRPQYVVTDIIRHKGEFVNKMPWAERQAILVELVTYWKDVLGHAVDNSVVIYAPFWETEEHKRAIHEWSIENGYEGLRLIKKDGTYNFNGRSWEHVLDLASDHYYVLVTGYENAEDTKHGPLGQVDKIRVGQYDESGALINAGLVDPWSDTSREILSRERERWMGRVLEVESVGYAPNGTFQKARLIGFRANLRPEHCLFKVTTEAITV